MDPRKKLLLEPDWPRVRPLVAEKLGKTEDEVQAMSDKGDSLDKVYLVMAIEEVLEKIHR